MLSWTIPLAIGAWIAIIYSTVKGSYISPPSWIWALACTGLALAGVCFRLIKWAWSGV